MVRKQKLNVNPLGGTAMTDREKFSFEDIGYLTRAFQQCRVFLTAFELDIFTVLGDSAKTSEEIAREIKADARATDRLLNALCATEAITKSKGKFRNSKTASEFLVKGKPEYQAGIMHSVHLWDSWTKLTDSVKTGGLEKKSPVEKMESDWFEPFIAAMHNRALDEAPALVHQIDLTGVKKVLDVGGGSGAYSMAFASAKRDILSTVFDLPTVIPLTKRYLEEDGLAARVDTVIGDYNTDELPSGYDLVFLSAIIHSNSPEQNIALFKKIYNSLNSGGRIVISDFIMDDDRTNPAFGAFFALNMLVNTTSGDTYTQSEIKRWIEQAGMTFVERKEARNTGLIFGRKT